MRAGRHFNIFQIRQHFFQLPDHLLIQYMLDGIGAPVDLTWRNIRMGNQIGFPQPVFANDLIGRLQSLIGQLEQLIPVGLNQSFGQGGFQCSAQLTGRPGPG